MADFEFTQQQMSDGIKGFEEGRAALTANINKLQQEYQDAIARGLAGRNVAALVRLYEDGIRPTCLDIAKNLGVMGDQLKKSQNQYNQNFDDTAVTSYNKLLGAPGGGGPAGPLSQAITA